MDPTSTTQNPLLSSDDFCAQCHVSFANRADFVKHCKVAHASLCTICNRKYVSQKALEQHYRDSPTVHPHCEQCEAGFLDIRSLQSHVAVAHADKDSQPDAKSLSSATDPVTVNAPSSKPQSFRCELCKRKYVSEKALEQHFRDSTLHPTCTLCEAAFFDARSLESVAYSLGSRGCCI
ncbi:hypothetical protein OF83DRAFT_575783 [Amylostereum chailletii]|nr:hypothetical protein OF83DRAFT_575783 [Amylostereum chailletii]